MRKLLFISINDGSDTRIVKEVQALSRQFEITYVGIGRRGPAAFAEQFCTHFLVTEGHHRQAGAFVLYYLRVCGLLLRGGWHSIHVINENLFLFFLPLLIFYPGRTVLDVFDSMFLRMAPRRLRWLGWLRQLIYGQAGHILVTDDNRRQLMPPGYAAKTVVVDNFPFAYPGVLPPKRSAPGHVLIYYSGGLSAPRGTPQMVAMLAAAPGLHLTMAGWVYDEESRALTQHPRVRYLGTVTQQESMALAAEADYILCLYAPTNLNNLNASPNKINDAIQAGTPVIINAEIKVASWVAEQGVGVVVPDFDMQNAAELYAELLARKGTFRFSDQMRARHTWQAVEGRLLAAHTRD